MEDFIKNLVTPAHITSIIIFIGLIVLLIVAKVALNSFKKKFNDIDATRKNALNASYNVIRAIIIVVSVIAILQINGINVTSIITGLGIASVIVGLAIQDPLRDLVSGIRISTDHFFSVGDVVEFQGVEGVVKYFSLRTTKIEDIETKTIYVISNRDIAEIKKIGSFFDIDLNLSYNDDFRKINTVLADAALKIEDIEEVTKCIFKGTEKFGESAITYKLRIHCNPVDKYDVNRKALSIIQIILEENNIHIPFNQLDVHCNIIEK